MRRTELLLALLAALIVTSAVTANLPTTTAQQEAIIAVTPLITDNHTPKGVGDTFSINITIANVVKLWGYEFTLRYNASIINATSQTTLDSRFTQELAVEIGKNYTHVSRATFYGDTVGITTTTPIPVEKIDFLVTGNGNSNMTIDPSLTQLASIFGAVIPSVSVSGRFSNTQILATHDIGITAATLSTNTGAVGDKITITVTVSNLGDFSENVTTMAKYNTSLTFFKAIETPKTITNLAAGTNQQVTYTWDTAGVDTGLHEITVNATIPVDDKFSDNTFFVGSVTLSTGGGTGGIPMQYIYIGVGVAIVVIAGIAVYALRARKPE